jgi:SPP1 gp7 family putative phage head morphogenesis protein
MNRFQRVLNRVGKLFWRENLKTEDGKRSRATIRTQLTTYPYRVENSAHEWESAYLSAINPIMPQRARLCAIYDKCMLDDEVAHQVRLAKNNLEFRPLSTGNVEMDKLFEQEWFADFVNSMIDAEMYGYSIVEIAIKNSTIFCDPIPHENIAHAQRQILIHSSDITSGQNFDDLVQQGYGLVEIGKPKHLGVMNIIAKCAIRKEFSLADWSMRNEKFGMPFTSLRTEAEDDDEIAERRKMLQNMGSASWGIFDKDDELSFVETGAGAGAHKTYQDFIADRDKAIAKLINGQTATSNENAFVGSSEVHERTQFAYTQSRMNRIEKVVNAQILPILARLGFNIGNAVFGYTKPKTPKESAKKEDSKSPAKQGLGSVDYLSSKFSIKDFFENTVKRYFDGFDEIADKYLAEYNFSQIWKEVQKPILEYSDDAKEIQQNIWAFSVFKSHENAIELTDALTDDNGKIRNWQNYREIATQITQKYNVEYLRTEQETALGVAKMAQNWKNIEYNFGEKAMLQYLTVGDARVRECHKKLDGVTLPADHDFWKEFYPPNGYRCRCSAKVVEDDAAQTPDYYVPTEKEVPISFRFNAGQNNRLFDENHPYLANLDDKTANKIKEWIKENPKPKL